MEELNELKNLVMQNLEKNGYLSNIRAQIRSSVFKTIDSQEGGSKKVVQLRSRPLPSSPKTLRFRSWPKAVKDKTLYSSFRSSFSSTKWSTPSRSSTPSPTSNQSRSEKRSLPITVLNRPTMSLLFIQSSQIIWPRTKNLSSRRMRDLKSCHRCPSR